MCGLCLHGRNCIRWAIATITHGHMAHARWPSLHVGGRRACRQATHIMQHHLTSREQQRAHCVTVWLPDEIWITQNAKGTGRQGMTCAGRTNCACIYHAFPDQSHNFSMHDDAFIHVVTAGSMAEGQMEDGTRQHGCSGGLNSSIPW